MIEHAVCFDRDQTVDVNPYTKSHVESVHDVELESPVAVPLSWVKELAHRRDDVHVWASGNQYLRREAKIPGIAEARDIYEAGAGERYFSDSTTTPSRREGLRLVRDLYDVYPPDPEVIVVDDVDLTDMETIFHYFPWDFTEAVENDRTSLGFEPTEGFCNEPVHSDRCQCELGPALRMPND